MAGIPTTIITREGFSPVVFNAYAGVGFAAEAPVLYEFANAMLLEGSDLTPIHQNIDKVVAGLTTWVPKVKARGVYPAPLVAVEASDHAKAVAKFQNLCLTNLWADGLPVTPPTEAQVKWLTSGTNLTPDTVVGKILPRGGLATVHSIAVNLAMAGGRPEYMPVLIAIVKAVADPKFQLQNVTPSSNSNYIAAIVNGPIAKDIRLNSGYGLVGPNPTYPAGVCIGRALALIIQNLGGAIPGLTAMELYGGMRCTNAVFAEDEKGLPPGWDPFSVERGYKKGDNVVTVLPVSSAVNITIMKSDNPDAAAAAEAYLQRIAGNMRGPNMNAWDSECSHKTPDFAPGLVFLPRTWAQQWAKLGWDKARLKECLREASKVPWEDLQQWGITNQAKVTGGASPTQPGYLTETPEQIRVLVAGGWQSAHAYWMEVGKNTELVSAGIETPSNWKDLLKAAEEDLGPIPPN